MSFPSVFIGNLEFVKEALQKVKIISIVGESGAGKTTLMKKLVPELEKKGLEIVVMKHTSGRIRFDKKGKDSKN